MSHLLYLQSFAVDRFVEVFGGGNTAHVQQLLKKVHPNAIKLAPAKATALVTKAITVGLDDGKAGAASKDEQLLLDAIVAQAIGTKSFGIATTPISPMGVGGPLFDQFESRFEEAGSTARKLFKLLQVGRNLEGGIILLSPSDVTAAAKALKKIVAQQDEDDADEWDEEFTSELVDPFTSAAKKRRAVFGRWS